MERILVLIMLVVASGVLFFSGCAVNPVTGEQQLMLVSEQEEVQMGLSTDQSVSNQYGVYEDPALQDYLLAMGLSMARNSHRPSLNWQFKVMDTPVINAFAAPGGYVYVTRGLLAAVNDEAELAGILGHEIGHVTARHSAQQYSSMMLANLGLNLGQTLLGSYGDLLSPILETGAGLLFLKFSRDDEREADALGVEYATRAGYDAGRMADFFITLQRQPGTGGSQPERLPEFFSTHPNPVNREATVRALAAQWQSKTPGQVFRVNRDQFLNHLDGLVYGEDPRQGFQDGDWYYLPRFRVKIPIPKGWELEREGNNLQISHPQGKAAAIVNIRTGNSVDQVISAFLKSTGAHVQQQRSLTNGPMPGRQILSVISSGRQYAVIVSHFYQNGPDVFAFHGITGGADYSATGDVMQQPGSGFAVMTDSAKLNRQPRRIALTTLAKSSSMKQTLLVMKIQRDLWQEIAWLNGRQLTDTLAAGTRLKLIK